MCACKDMRERERKKERKKERNKAKRENVDRKREEVENCFLKCVCA